jgi:acetoin utilization protein AcuB
MLVKYWMNKESIAIDGSASMQDAMDMMKRRSVRLLPVMKKNKLAGVISDRDLKRASASDATTLEIHELLYLLSKIKVEEIMSSPAITVQSNHTIEETAEILLHNKISGAPVLDSAGALMGVITQDDLFRALVALTGVQGRGLHIAMILEDRPGTIMDIANVVREVGGRTVSILTSHNRCAPGYRRVYFRIYQMNREKIDRLLVSIGERAQLLYMVDHRENRREIFKE